MDQYVEIVDQFWHNLQAGNFQQWGYWNYGILLLLVAVEGPIATLLGAAAASAGFMRLTLVFLAASVGNLVADAGWYSLGYFSDQEWLLRYGRWLGLRRHHLERLQNGMHAHARKILIIAKLSAGFVIPTLIAAGLAKVPVRRWFPVVFVGELLWTTALVFIGFHATEAIKSVELGLHYLAIGGALLVALLVLFIGRKQLRPEGVVATVPDEAATAAEGESHDLWETSSAESGRINLPSTPSLQHKTNGAAPSPERTKER